ncbi:MAG: TetR/AcrR family transcriptional regulator [Pseudomonadota bacterium]
MAEDTRTRILDTAERLFADRGFYGVSIAAIATEIDLTKQALLHHFGSKEKLYGEVLKRISQRFELDLSKAQPSGDDPVERLVASLLHLQTRNTDQPNVIHLLMRELLDNKRRADTVGTWYLEPFLERLTCMVAATPKYNDATLEEAFAATYQLLGAINYFGVSQPTLTGIYGERFYAKIEADFPQQLEALIRSAVAP